MKIFPQRIIIFRKQYLNSFIHVSYITILSSTARHTNLTKPYYYSKPS